ncbi:MAG: hypothetical protein Q9163_004949 [Psora crenata]
MATIDTLLSLDIGLYDCLYRIRRDAGGVSHVVYIKVTELDIIPEDRRTYGPDIVRELSALESWSDVWDTLTISKDGDGIKCHLDAFRPHSLPEAHLPGNYERFNVLDIPILRHVKDRVYQVASSSGSCFLKIAKFGHELGWLAQEIAVYHILTDMKSQLAPRLLGYAFEERGNRVMGFLFEEVNGRLPVVEDIEICGNALQQLHDLNIIHGDVNKYNIFITDDGAKFIDFEESQMGPDVNEGLKAKEMETLKQELIENSGKGRPWTHEAVATRGEKQVRLQGYENNPSKSQEGIDVQSAEDYKEAWEKSNVLQQESMD